MIRQQLMQHFREAGQWASLVDISMLPAPQSSELCNSAQTEYKSGSQPSADMLLKDLAIWLGKQVGVTVRYHISYFRDKYAQHIYLYIRYHI